MGQYATVDMAARDVRKAIGTIGCRHQAENLHRERGRRSGLAVKHGAVSAGQLEIVSRRAGKLDLKSLGPKPWIRDLGGPAL